MRLRAYTPYAPACLYSPISTLRVFFGLVLLLQLLLQLHGLRLKNPRKATGPDFITLKVIKFALNVIDSHLYNIIIKDLEKNKYLEEPKTALVRPTFKKNERSNSKIRNYRPGSILYRMSKIHGRYIYNSPSSYAETILIKFHISL